MRSKTKPAVDRVTIARLFENAGIHGIGNITPLGAGEFNAVYSVDAAATAYAIKIAPPPSARILTYEQHMMTQELHFYDIMAKQARISVPAIIYADLSKTKFPAEFFIMERLPGKQLDQARLSGAQKQEAGRILAEMVARMHAVKGEGFGYRQNGLHDNWHAALVAMVTNLIQDAANMGKETPTGERLLASIHAHRRVLEKVDCRLINFDVWPPNIICNWEDGKLTLSWIDPERCLWGDRIADFVCLDFMNMSLERKLATIESYNRASETPIVIGDEERIRFAIMLGYLGLIMEVEKVARYTVLHYGYWRNVMVARMLLSSCFHQLDALR